MKDSNLLIDEFIRIAYEKEEDAQNDEMFYENNLVNTGIPEWYNDSDIVVVYTY